MSKLITEFKNYLDEQELLEMINVDEETTGIENVVIWIGPNPQSHGKRIKISNVPNTFEGSDCFTLTIPGFKIIGTVNKSLIDNNKLEQIKEFVQINVDVIIDYSDYKISTKNLLDNLKRVEVL